MSEDQPTVKPHVQGESVNLDTTALVALCSGLAHGESVGTDPHLLPQEKEERERPFLDIARTLIGGELLVSETARREFVHIVEKLAGTRERGRAEQLLQRVTLVPDHPSDRVCALRPTAQIKPRHVAIFGTGDRLGVPTVTANQTFVRAAAEQGMKLCVILHQPRSLSELRAENSRAHIHEHQS